LDVIGNPYGLVVGVTEGVEAFFYEPFQGAIQGPGEFAEGLALGCKALLGHTVGGAAGALSKITGTLGKGMAALTLDEEFKQKRREMLTKRPHDVTEAFARSGKGLVMGFFDGVTGVVTQPIKGAQDDGVEGFFKGLGKGAVGLFLRPVTGIVDFTSGSLDAVKRATSIADDIRRLRPPRHIPIDSVITPYVGHEAEGMQLLQVSSSRQSSKALREASARRDSNEASSSGSSSRKFRFF
jgi:vacuolar protein sorting-associated protein 13A/C